jgi:spore cortex formation protein SpoVR/YcgB (stage V sporulation)
VNSHENTLEYVRELWKEPVHLKTFNSQRETTAFTYAASGMQIGKSDAPRLSRIDRGRS